MNVETGETYGGFWAIVAADLSVNDRLHPSGQDSTTVNETVIRSYVCGERETNHLIVNFPTNETANANENADYYFDKKTGMLVELRDETSYVNPNRTIIISWKIRDSNVWTVPEFPSLLILPLFMIATLLAAIAYKKKRVRVGINSGADKPFEF